MGGAGMNSTLYCMAGGWDFITASLLTESWVCPWGKNPAKSPKKAAYKKNEKKYLKFSPSAWHMPWGNAVTLCLHLVCNGKERVLVFVVCFPASPRRGGQPGVFSTDLYIQIEPKPPPAAEQNTQAPNILTWVQGQAGSTQRLQFRHHLLLAWYIVGQCTWPQKCLWILPSHSQGWLDAAAGRTSS